MSGFEPKRFLKRFDRKCICKKAKVSRRGPKQNENVSVDSCSKYRYVFIYFFSKVRDPEKLREKYYKKRGFKADIICLLPLELLSSLIFCKYFKTVPYFCVWILDKTLHMLPVNSVIDTKLCFDVIERNPRGILSSTYILNILCFMTRKKR